MTSLEVTELRLSPNAVDYVYHYDGDNDPNNSRHQIACHAEELFFGVNDHAGNRHT